MIGSITPIFENLKTVLYHSTLMYNVQIIPNFFLFFKFAWTIAPTRMCDLKHHCVFKGNLKSLTKLSYMYFINYEVLYSSLVLVFKFWTYEYLAIPEREELTSECPSRIKNSIKSPSFINTVFSLIGCFPLKMPKLRVLAMQV